MTLRVDQTGATATLGNHAADHVATNTQVNTNTTAIASLTTSVAAKAADTAVVHNTGNETVAGTKTFSSDIVVPAEVYGVGWNGSNEAPTKNDLYDKIETISGGVGDVTQAGDNTFTGANTFQGDLDLSSINIDLSSSTIEGSFGIIDLTDNGEISVTDSAYNSGWNGSLKVPTRNAVYDKIESLSPGVSEELAIAYSVAL